MIIRFCVWSIQGKLITSGTMPHLTEKEQLEYALSIAKKYPQATLHCHPNHATVGLFILRDKHLRDTTLESAWTKWRDRASKEQW